MSGESTDEGVVNIHALEFPPLKFTLPEVARLELDNGLILYLYEDHSLPLLNFFAVVRTGAVWEPADKAGLAALTGDVMRTGGIEGTSSEQVDEAIESLGAEVGVSIGRERGTATLSVLKDDLDEGLRIFADMLRRPAFEQAKLDQRKAELAEEFRRENDNPEDIVGREFRRVLYAEHPYARRVSGYPETIARITRDDLVAFHARYFHPNNMILGVSGDFSSEDLVGKIKAVFADWSRQPVDLPVVDEPVERARANYFIEKDVTQSSLYMGHLAVNRLDPDYDALAVMNFIFGGSSFNARLVDEVRTKAGLAYAVGSWYVCPRWRGFLIAYCVTKTESTAQAAEKMVGEMQRLRDGGVTDDEFRRAKEALENQFVETLKTSRSLVAEVVSNEYDGLPRDYLSTYLDRLRAVTKADVDAVARKHMRPDALTVVILGNRSALDAFPESFGPFEDIVLR